MRNKDLTPTLSASGGQGEIIVKRSIKKNKTGKEFTFLWLPGGSWQARCLMLLLFFTFHFSLFTFSQTSTNSPYSRYGLGDLQFSGFAQQTGMGSLGISVAADTTAPFGINFLNPASYTNLRITAFDFGLTSNTVFYQTQNQKQAINTTALSSIAFGLPLTKWWGMSFGIMPFSSTGYSLSDTISYNYTGDVEYKYEGDGGINRVFIGNGIRPFLNLPDKFKRSEKRRQWNAAGEGKKIVNREKALHNLSSFSIGANASFLFGQINHTRKDIFFNSNYFNTRSTRTTEVSDFYFDFGASYKVRIDSMLTKKHPKGDTLSQKKWLKREMEDVYVSFGLTVTPAENIRAKSNVLTETFKLTGAGIEIPKDTIENFTEKSGKITLPMYLGGGISIKKGDKWTVGAEYVMQDWSKFDFFGKNENLKNSSRISVGAQYIPKKFADIKDSYLKKMHYRGGFRYTQTYLELKNTQLTDMAVTLGFGFPLRRYKVVDTYTQSILNLGVELGQRGTVNNGLIKEQYVKVTLGFTLNDKWFIKRKYD